MFDIIKSSCFYIGCLGYCIYDLSIEYNATDWKIAKLQLMVKITAALSMSNSSTVCRQTSVLNDKE